VPLITKKAIRIPITGPPTVQCVRVWDGVSERITMEPSCPPEF
jgi:hypothetical protein